MQSHIVGIYDKRLYSITLGYILYSFSLGLSNSISDNCIGIPVISSQVTVTFRKYPFISTRYFAGATPQHKAHILSHSDIVNNYSQAAMPICSYAIVSNQKNVSAECGVQFKPKKVHFKRGQATLVITPMADPQPPTCRLPSLLQPQF